MVSGDSGGDVGTEITFSQDCLFDAFGVGGARGGGAPGQGLPRVCCGLSRMGPSLGEEGHECAHGEFGLGTEFLVAVVGDRVRDDDEGVVGQAVEAGHGARALLEPLGHDGDRRDAHALGGQGVVQTARRATASVADPG